MIKYCEVCGHPFVCRGNQVTCSPECRKKRKSMKNKEWVEDNKEYLDGKRKLNKEHYNDLSREWARKNPEKRKATRRKNYLKHQDERMAKAREQSKDPEYRRRKNEARRLKTLEKHRLMAQAEQEELWKYAIEGNIGGEKYGDDTAEALINKYESIGIRRLTVNICECTRCGSVFVVSKSASDASHMLDLRLKAGKSPCPWCGEMPRNVRNNSSCRGSELEIARLYPNLSIGSIRPEWMQGLEIDLYDPDRKIGLEFHGMFWHSDRKGESGKHKRKADLCEEHGVQLIQIYESEWATRKEQVIDKLDSIFHRNMTPVSARKLTVHVMETKKERAAVTAFMEAAHIQGAAVSTWAVALMDGEEIIACCTFKYGTGYASGGQAAGTGKYWELNRYATKLHTLVRGGLSRCIRAFEKSHPEVNTIVSFADRRWTCPTRSAYASSGFMETGRVEPNYQYTDLKASHGLRNKQYMRKSSIEERARKDPSGPESRVFSTEKTEYEMARELGYYRIYDAGKIRYEMKINQKA